MDTCRKCLTPETGPCRGCERVGIGLRLVEEARHSSGELGFRYSRPELAIAERVPGSADVETNCGRATRHRLQECDAEAFPGRRHHEQVSRAVGLYQTLQLDSAEETHALPHPCIPRQGFETRSVVAF